MGPGWDAGVDVWPMLMGTNATQPREYTPTSDYGIVWGTWKLVVLGGQSNYYTENATHINPPEWTLPCLAGSDDRQGGVDNPVSGCVICNATAPCLFDLSGPTGKSETANVAAEHPELVATLQAKLNSFVPCKSVIFVESTGAPN